MKGRKVYKDELKLWREVTKHTQKMDYLSSTAVVDLDVKPSKAIVQNRPKTPVATPPKPITSPASGTHIVMDKKTHQTMTRGKIDPEAVLDLHGMTMDQAKPVLTRFIQSSHRQELRLILVITGKGKTQQDIGPIPQPVGILKTNVPLWLEQRPLAGMILQITAAHPKHGGSGAYYVYLRRNR